MNGQGALAWTAGSLIGGGLSVELAGVSPGIGLLSAGITLSLATVIETALAR